MIAQEIFTGLFADIYFKTDWFTIDLTTKELLSGLWVIAGLVVIEGLLSVDNVLGIAALANDLPEHQQKKAIRLGLAGAYLFRVGALLVASWLITHTWVRWLGAGYLIWLMCAHLTRHDKEVEGGKKIVAKATLAAVLLQIGLMDLSLSIDNVIAAVGLAPLDENTGEKVMWPIYVGVGIAILALQAIAPHAVKLLKRYPILEPTAFILIGFVGGILIFEESWQIIRHEHLHIHPGAKFGGILFIIWIALLYSADRSVKRRLQPLIRMARPLMWGFATSMSLLVRRPHILVLLSIGAALGYIGSYFGQSGLMREFASLGDYLSIAPDVLMPHSSDGFTGHLNRAVCLTAWAGLALGVAIVAGIMIYLGVRRKQTPEGDPSGNR